MALIGKHSNYKLIVATGLLCTLPGVAVAQKWEPSAALQVTVGSSDNERLEIDSLAEDSLETTYTAKIGASRAGPRSTLSVFANINHVQYSQIDFDNENNQTVGLGGSYRPQSDMTYGIDARYERDTYSSRFNVNDIVQGDDSPLDLGQGGIQNGLTDLNDGQGQVRVKRSFIDPYINWELGPRANLRATVNYRESKFDDGNQQSLFDYDDLEVGAEYKYSLSKARVDSLTFRVAHAEYSSDNVDSVERTRIPVTLIYQRPFTKNLYLSASAGAVFIDSEEDGSSSQTEPTFGAFVRWQGARFDLQFGVNRYIQAGSTASLRATNQVLGTYLFNWSRRQKVGATIQYYENEELSENNGQVLRDDQTYLTVEPTWIWEISRALQLRASYSFRSLEQDNREDAESNTFMATLTYKLWN